MQEIGYDLYLSFVITPKYLTPFISDNETLKDLTPSDYLKIGRGLKDLLISMKLGDPDHRRVLHLLELIRYHPEERVHAIEQLHGTGKAAGHASALIEALRDEDTNIAAPPPMRSGRSARPPPTPFPHSSRPSATKTRTCAAPPPMRSGKSARPPRRRSRTHRDPPRRRHEHAPRHRRCARNVGPAAATPFPHSSRPSATRLIRAPRRRRCAREGWPGRGRRRSRTHRGPPRQQ